MGRGSNVTLTDGASSAQPLPNKSMTANFRKPGLLYPALSASTLPMPAPFPARSRTSNRRPHANAGQTKEYRRAARAAELAVWEATIPSETAMLRAHVADAAQDSATEKWAFRLIAALALTGILWGLVTSFELVEQWPTFVATIRQLIP